ncbi:alpha/beta fold hydrolase [Psychrobacter sp. FDAARGOS_221]|uniref:alpha/beta fold hydrolase n=1 Tax=Psychrobacter sp. FDAARGOS_221 TaxID=1975705 RepID=UPI000BB580C7|nr:alpha/beta hydrolase [Psychrobacter sp. FDAARGOS_221]PNK60496.1 alpha/beta hydrolase [Psychrobacter sp. FDAARGOS_221]
MLTIKSNKPRSNSSKSKISQRPPKLLAAATSVFKPYQLQLQQVVSYDGSCIPVHMIGDGEPVLLLHAFGMDARQFLPFILPLADRFRFYLPHLRGFGLAAATPSTEFNFIEQYADDVAVLLDYICDKHEVDAIDVAGISMGALVMWAHFARHANPEQPANLHKVRRYLNIDQSPIVHNQPDWQGGVFGDRQPQVFERFEQVLQAALPYFQHSVTEFSHLPFAVKQQVLKLEADFSLMSVARPASRLFIQTSSYLPDHKLALYQHPTWRQKLHGLQAYLHLPYDYREALAATDIPVTLLIGQQSKLYDPNWQRQLAQLLPQADIVEVADSGHAIPLDAPIRFTQALKAFLID